MDQTKRFKQFAIGITFAIAISLTACSNNDANADTTAPPSSEAPTMQPSTSPSAEPTIAPEATDKPSSAPESGKGDEEGGAEADQLIGSIYKLAKEGKVSGSEYAAHDSMYDDIEKSWGKADTNESAGNGIYATYDKKGITFGYNKGMRVFDVRSYSDKLNAITLKDLEIALGSADEKTVNGTDRIYTYKVNKQYELKFVISESTGKVDHISVYSPDDAKNNMAG